MQISLTKQTGLNPTTRIKSLVDSIYTNQISPDAIQACRRPYFMTLLAIYKATLLAEEA